MSAAGAWVRGDGYDETLLAERRHPVRTDLDRAGGELPALLHHAAGHVVVANTRALLALGLDPGGDGLLVDAEPLLAARVPRPPRSELADAVADLSRELAAAGVTSCTDASATNDLAQLRFLRSLVDGGVVRQRLVVMPGAEHLGEVVAAGLSYGSGDAMFRVGHAKILPPVGVGVGELVEPVRAAHAAGWPVAVHAVDVDQLEAALVALEASSPPPGTRDRLEHNALSLPEQVERIASVGAMVVTQPGFLVHRAERYRSELTAVELAWLYRVASLLERGVPVALSSDAPVVPARPVEAMAAAVCRRGEEGVDAPTALMLATSGAAAVGPSFGDGPEDSIVLSCDPTRLRADPAAWESVDVLKTSIHGVVAEVDGVV